MTRSCPTPACPYRERLEQANVYHRAQHAEIARLQELLGRYQRLGLRRLRQSPLDTLTPSGLWCDNFLLERAIAQRDATIQQQARLIATLKHVLTPGEGLRVGLEVP
jgi:hypothetical protein